MAARDEEFSEYVAQRRTQLRRIAYLLCGDVHKAEDLVQTALMKLYVAWNRVQRSGNVDAYVRRILVNSGIDESRRPWRRENAGLDGLDPVATEGLAFEDRGALLAALNTLPSGQRRVVVLRFFVGLTIEETATDLHCSTGTVKSQSSRALARLNELLTPDFRAVGGPR
ncbi:SigE family RNA polymerase sigma factor [Kribbella sandramycini]|uniref:RNA polymerase sigma-70 factor (Sigma-E family) n=1 Tax=Kribbella sandramycini TaxID=60450 RepID=A0A7Y4P2U1_9ACTN|nr:SigE family RNA polymerase sigma factor [Kribbella sandramycini]MBB6571162.1 RNA polymerase sigma-70 factor (sigma-E family) [Kribbella sandramycini]NOL43430.1 SigE family RNA polymerase sigma factor [Kribbella sandramycini]